MTVSSWPTASSGEQELRMVQGHRAAGPDVRHLDRRDGDKEKSSAPYLLPSAGDSVKPSKAVRFERRCFWARHLFPAHLQSRHGQAGACS
jgi:hypothetical protein